MVAVSATGSRFLMNTQHPKFCHSLLSELQVCNLTMSLVNYVEYGIAETPV